MQEQETTTALETKPKAVAIIDFKGFIKLAKKMKKLEAWYEYYVDRCPITAARIMKSYKSALRKLEVKTNIRRTA